MTRLAPRLAPLAMILSILAGPSLAGGLTLDLPTLTWPTEESAPVLGTKSATKP